MFAQTPNEEMYLNQLSCIIDNIFKIISSGTFQGILGFIILIIVAFNFKKESDWIKLIKPFFENISKNNKTFLTIEQIEVIYELHFQSTKLALIESLEKFIKVKIQTKEDTYEYKKIKDDVMGEIIKVILSQRNTLLTFPIPNNSKKTISMRKFLEGAVNIEDKNLIPEEEMDNFIKELRKILESKNYNYEWIDSFNNLVRKFETKSKSNLKAKLNDLSTELYRNDG